MWKWGFCLKAVFLIFLLLDAAFLSFCLLFAFFLSFFQPLYSKWCIMECSCKADHNKDNFDKENLAKTTIIKTTKKIILNSFKTFFSVSVVLFGHFDSLSGFPYAEFWVNILCQCQILCQCPHSGHKTCSYREKKTKTLLQMTYTIGMVWPRQFVEPGLGLSTYFDFGARLFQRSGHHMVPISCKAS